jgi:hypothetical protein
MPEQPQTPKSVTVELPVPLETPNGVIERVLVFRPILKHAPLMNRLGLALKLEQKEGTVSQIEITGLGSLIQDSIHQLTDLPAELADQLDWASVMPIMEAVLGFFGLGEMTGGLIASGLQPPSDSPPPK